MNTHPLTPNAEKLAWRKSSYSDGEGQNCVEIAMLDGAVAVRDSKAPDNPHLMIPRDRFAALITAISRH
ncbi:DUF397 domain-containing protein [Streptomyces avicenniae]|uniref:DUF397 domain-containing protein n=1 Tax=Streptomyces avicenniae TaxID=500153 RepID=UPI000B04B1B2|nr:DUF397 domain-containing protein [Streptomyces avicenniae]